MKKNQLFLLLAAFCLVFMSHPVTAKAAEGAQSEEFRVGLEAGYAPFNWTQTADEENVVPIFGEEGSAYAGGYDVQIAKRIAEGLDRELVIVKVQWDGLVPALQSGTIDAVIAGMSPTAERQEQIDFTDAYYESDLVLVTRMLVKGLLTKLSSAIFQSWTMAFFVPFFLSFVLVS